MKHEELCQWLRENSSGVYRKCRDAADVIEAQERQMSAMRLAMCIAADWIEASPLERALPHAVYLRKLVGPDESEQLKREEEERISLLREMNFLLTSGSISQGFPRRCEFVSRLKSILGEA